jgi:hypothetical protein
MQVGDIITKRCKLYINEIYKTGNIGCFIDLLLERIKHPSLSDVSYRVVGHSGYDAIEFEVEGHYQEKEAMRLDGVLDADE